MSYLLRALIRQWPMWSPILLGGVCIVSATVLHRPIVILNRLVAERIFVGRPRHRRSAPATWFSEAAVEKPAKVPEYFWLRTTVVICGVGIVLWRISSVIFR